MGRAAKRRAMENLGRRPRNGAHPERALKARPKDAMFLLDWPNDIDGIAVGRAYSADIGLA